ncbi:hypothetical protein SAMN00790413_05674 [Deinococcus hopiensis KR-140]|uniref:Uncharacterized protein n=1 Tax=Deinococcus hopiensis KR-140 TaxID=695939 RepID=A0A1W1UDI8_9DEIO|nr:hypothetical protein SAMN00790413_05674 [Deinococcus hopiensis KR-140]
MFSSIGRIVCTQDLQPGAEEKIGRRTTSDSALLLPQRHIDFFIAGLYNCRQLQASLGYVPPPISPVGMIMGLALRSAHWIY